MNDRYVTLPFLMCFYYKGEYLLCILLMNCILQYYHFLVFMTILLGLNNSKKKQECQSTGEQKTIISSRVDRNSLKYTGHIDCCRNSLGDIPNRFLKTFEK